MNSSVFAAVPSARGSSDSKTNSAAAANAQKSFINRRPNRKMAHADAAENISAAKCTARMGSIGKAKAAR